MENNVLSVTELTTILKELIEVNFSSITLEGEISNYKPSSSGHVYFTLKDTNAAIAAVMFRGRCQYLNFTPKDGMLVRVTGSLSVYPQRGSYQILVNTMEQAGSGDILRLLEERKQRLALEGLFDSDNKRQLPFFPATVGVVSSPTGAAVRDIVQIVQRRNPKINVIIFPCAVQGVEAAAQIVHQIETANAFNLVDVLIIGRGGGSLEDLLPFSEESVVRAVASSNIPTISAVGHEIDWALSDFAADQRAPTPSAAAELATPLLSDLQSQLQYYSDSLYHGVQNKFEKTKLLLKSFSLESMELRFRNIEQPLLQRFDDGKESLLDSLSEKVSDFKQRIVNAVQNLEGANPLTILARGYAMVRNSTTGEIVRSPSQTKEGEILEIIPQTGTIFAQVCTKKD